MTTRSRQPHVPLEPLRRWLGRDKAASWRDTASLLGVKRSSLQYWGSEGIPLDTAERLAIELGAHPSNIWPWFDEIESCWASTAWLRKLRTQAVLESWRLRLDCQGVAGDAARLMFNEGAA